MARDNYAVVTDRIIEALEAGVVPWRRPWNVANRGPLRNGKSGHEYRGINVPLLSLTAHASGYSDPRWLTFKQARELGGHVRRGEKGTAVVLWKWIRKEREDEDGETVVSRYPILKTYSVFNAAQVEDVEWHNRFGCVRRAARAWKGPSELESNARCTRRSALAAGPRCPHASGSSLPKPNYASFGEMQT